MGATTFTHHVAGPIPVAEAFTKARESAAWEYGHGGYTGTIAEKPSYIEFARPDLPEWTDLETAVNEAIGDPWSGGPVEVPVRVDCKHEDNDGDRDGCRVCWGTERRFEPRPLPDDVSKELNRISALLQDKWGPAGAMPDGNGGWLFFGWASC
jgi:hypothetical protein